MDVFSLRRVFTINNTLVSINVRKIFFKKNYLCYLIFLTFNKIRLYTTTIFTVQSYTYSIKSHVTKTGFNWGKRQTGSNLNLE